MSTPKHAITIRKTYSHKRGTVYLITGKSKHSATTWNGAVRACMSDAAWPAKGKARRLINNYLEQHAAKPDGAPLGAAPAQQQMEQEFPAASARQKEICRRLRLARGLHQKVNALFSSPLLEHLI